MAKRGKELGLTREMSPSWGLPVTVAADRGQVSPRSTAQYLPTDQYAIYRMSVPVQSKPSRLWLTSTRERYLTLPCLVLPRHDRMYRNQRVL